MKHLFLKTFCFAVCLAPVSALAAEGYTTANVNLRSGPGTDFPSVEIVEEGESVEIYGCLETIPWCDVSYEEQRGWISSAYIDIDYHGRTVTLEPRYYQTMRIPVVTFEFDDYWNRHYRRRGFYNRRDHWRDYYAREVFRPAQPIPRRFPGVRPPPPPPVDYYSRPGRRPSSGWGEEHREPPRNIMRPRPGALPPAARPQGPQGHQPGVRPSGPSGSGAPPPVTRPQGPQGYQPGVRPGVPPPAVRPQGPQGYQPGVRPGGPGAPPPATRSQGLKGPQPGINPNPVRPDGAPHGIKRR